MQDQVIRMLRISFLFLAMFYLMTVLDEPRSASPIEKEICALRQHLPSEKLKQAVDDASKSLSGNDAIALRQSMDLFHRLHAKRVLLALFRSTGSKEWIFKDHIVLYCLDVFSVEDIPDLFEVAYLTLPAGLQSGSEEIAARAGFAERLTIRTSTMLGIKQEPIHGYTRENLRNWWIQAVKTAKEKQTVASGFDTTLKYFENLERDGANSKK